MFCVSETWQRWTFHLVRDSAILGGNFLLFMIWWVNQRSHLVSSVASDSNIYAWESNTTFTVVKVPLSREDSMHVQRLSCAKLSPSEQQQYPYLQLSPLVLSGKDIPPAGGSGPSQLEPQHCAGRCFPGLHPTERHRSWIPYGQLKRIINSCPRWAAISQPSYRAPTGHRPHPGEWTYTANIKPLILAKSGKTILPCILLFLNLSKTRGRSKKEAF